MPGTDTQAQDAALAKRLCDDGYALLEKGRYQDAGARLLRARELAPSDPLVHFRLALFYSDTGRLPEALDSLDRSLELQPNDARVHNNRGLILHQFERLAEAEDAYRRALALDSRLVQPYLNLGEILERDGKMADAVRLYESAIAHGLDAGVFGHRIAAATGAVTDRAPDSWVRTTFDDFAPLFDAKLSRLRYNVPQQLADLVATQVPAGLLDILDLGCGTGQCGVAFATRRRHLAGVDLSERMIARARARNLYHELSATEIHEWLRASPPEQFDLVVAADVLIYIGVLAELMSEVARVLRPRGWFAFSTEECEGADYRLLPSGRYAQSQDYVRRSADAAFSVVAADHTLLRMDDGPSVMGRLYLLRRDKGPGAAVHTRAESER